ncbi:KdtA [Desulforapulum autotrophicum HRM2]|uniref:3-deoxy-D-manno-octulosonic acid transferase n=1 Tax=Desulforapulum autotrophicum (strain ATCC 43914 / DSM 3382 / VKM B-1955 / HRM2) TaxID=177437 RepID=C0QBR7_DESAH|nr:glycosyltransferase N-terminal domain-containing protein [Desulforapulum autotrophicum]ACN14929.1 KdtA [Desulforapulum autotrophicum HRM2]
MNNQWESDQNRLNRILGLYGFAWRLALPWLKKTRRLRRGFDQRTNVHHLTRSDIWIQAASAGEAYLASALIRTMMPDHELTVLVTTTTPQGMDILKKTLSPMEISPHISVVFSFFPFDSPDLMDAAVSRICPGVMVLLETELWPGLLASLNKRQIPIIMINARLSEKSLARYQKAPWLCRTLAPHIILAISPEDARRFRKIFPQTTIDTMPNIKFDTVMPQEMETNPGNCLLPQNPFPKGTPVTLLASIRREEEEETADILGQILFQHPNQVVAIFPRHMHRIDFWQKTLTALGLSWKLRSAITKPVLPGTTILWDTFGELKAACFHATAAFVGGSLKPLGGQNFLEPVICGAAAVTGPYLDNFNWVGQELFSTGVVNRARNSREVVSHLCRHLNTPPRRQKITSKGINYIRRYQGGTQMAVNTILNTLQSGKK